MEIVFSIIIPVYNAESYLRRCVDSFLNQTFINYEIILINDGSTDSSGKICDEYSANNEKIRTLHQINAGVSAARNAGLDVAQGKYIVFADSDDFVEKDFLYNLFSYSVDLVIVGFKDFKNNEVIKVCTPRDDRWIVKSSKSIQKFLITGFSGSVCGKRYKKSIIKNNKIRFNENINYCEDRIFNNEYILNSSSIVSIPWAGYFRCLNESSSLTSRSYNMSFNERNLWRKISYDQYKDYPDIQDKFMNQTLYFAEIEFIKIANANLLFKVKSNAVKTIISDAFFVESVKKITGVLPKDVRFFCINKWAHIILLKYLKVRGV